MRTLRQCLIDTELAHLRVIARLWGLQIKAKRPLEIAAELSGMLADPEVAADAWDALPEHERVAVKALLDAGGAMPTAAFTRRFGKIRPMGPGRLEREAPWRDPVSPAEGLWYRGLIYEGFAGEAQETYGVFFIPAELLTALPVQAEGAVARIRLEPATPPAHHCVGGDLLLDDVTTVLGFVHNENVRPVADAVAAWPTETRERLVSRLRDPDPERLHFILHAIDHLDWARIGDDGRLRLVAEPVTDWLQKPSAAALIDAWRQLWNWDELWRLTDLQTDDTGSWHRDPTPARDALLRHLDALVPTEWVRIADFVGAIKAVDPDFQRPDGDYEAWYVRDPASGAYLTGFESWDRVEGALLCALLNGPARWLGLVELGAYGEGEASTVFRPRAGATTAPTAGSISLVNADMTVTLAAVRRFERFQLARVADLVRVDDPYVYRLTPASLQRARQKRIGIDRVLGFLGDLSDAPLPEAVRSSLARWAERGTEAWLERTLLLRVADEAVMGQILASPNTNRHIARILGPTTAAVAEKDWPDLVRALAELGMLAELGGLQGA